ncbi:MAG: hypothetical protein BECKG1743D_GA0114223_108392, partial [Candidatus Kentron sp. G]
LRFFAPEFYDLWRLVMKRDPTFAYASLDKLAAKSGIFFSGNHLNDVFFPDMIPDEGRIYSANMTSEITLYFYNKLKNKDKNTIELLREDFFAAPGHSWAMFGRQSDDFA